MLRATGGSERAHLTRCDAGLAEEVLHNCVQDELRLCLSCLQVGLLSLPQAIYQGFWDAGGVSHAGPGQQLLLECSALLAVELQRAGSILCEVLRASIWPVGQQLALSLPKLASSKNLRLL